VVVVAGNHDNPHRLAAVRPLLDLTRVRTAAFPARAAEGGTVELRTRRGAQVRLALLPFLSQRAIIRADQLMDEDADRHALHYAERAQRIVHALCERFDARSVNVVVSHLTVAGGATGGGEREAHTVFDYQVPAHVFPASAHYVALGHLHRTQRIPGACPIWYPGSPLQLDFGEASNDPAVLLVEAESDTPAEVRTVPIAGGRRLRTIRGALDRLEAVARAAGDAWLRVVVTEPWRAGLADDVRALLPHAVDVVVAREDAAGGEAEWSSEHARRSPGQLFDEYLEEKGVEDPQLAALFRTLLDDAEAAA
jgi:exonuclease SbcD